MYECRRRRCVGAYAFFDNNIVEKYTYNESVIDGVNVPARVYRISTNVTVHGGTINAGDTITEKSKKTGGKVERTATERLDYGGFRMCPFARLYYGVSYQ